MRQATGPFIYPYDFCIVYGVCVFVYTHTNTKWILLYYDKPVDGCSGCLWAAVVTAFWLWMIPSPSPTRLRWASWRMWVFRDEMGGGSWRLSRGRSWYISIMIPDLFQVEIVYRTLSVCGQVRSSSSKPSIPQAKPQSYHPSSSSVCSLIGPSDTPQPLSDFGRWSWPQQSQVRNKS